jgi:hypothetical protein
VLVEKLWMSAALAHQVMIDKVPTIATMIQDSTPV